MICNKPLERLSNSEKNDILGVQISQRIPDLRIFLMFIPCEILKNAFSLCFFVSFITSCLIHELLYTVEKPVIN